MSVEHVAQYLNILVAVVLVIRLFWLKLARKYAVFTALIGFSVAWSLIVALVPWRARHIDYRVAWLIFEPIAWTLYVWVVYAILQKIMAMHQGILSASRKLFAACFVASVIVGLLSARVEFVIARPDAPVTIALIVERAFCTVSLLLLLATLIYLLWFPVEVTRNTALLCAGLMVYFAAKTALLLLHDIWAPDSVRLVSLLLILVSTGCVTVWALGLSRAGEEEMVRPGHSWKPKEQERLVHQLEAINAVLLRSAKQ